MNIYFNRSVLYLLFIALLSCGKKGNDSPAIPRTDLLVKKKWQIEAISGRLANGTVIEDGFTDLPASQKDNYLYFFADLTYVMHDGTLMRPNASTPIIDNGTWKLVNLDEYIDLDSADPSVTYPTLKIVDLTETSLTTLSESSGNIQMVTYKVIP